MAFVQSSSIAWIQMTPQEIIVISNNNLQIPQIINPRGKLKKMATRLSNSL